MASRVKPGRKRAARLSRQTDMIVSRVLVITAAQVAKMLQDDHGWSEEEAGDFLRRLKVNLDEYGRQLAELHREMELPVSSPALSATAKSHSGTTGEGQTDIKSGTED